MTPFTMDRDQLEEWGRQVLALTACTSLAPVTVARAAQGDPMDVAAGLAWASDLAERSRALLLGMALMGLVPDDTGDPLPCVEGHPGGGRE